MTAAKALRYYIAAGLALSVVDLTYVSFVSLDEPANDMVGYHREIGLREGTLLWATHLDNDAIRGRFGWHAELHWPMLYALPAYSGAGPTSGAIRIAIWLPILVAVVVGRVRRERAAEIAAR